MLTCGNSLRALAKHPVVCPRRSAGARSGGRCQHRGLQSRQLPAPAPAADARRMKPGLSTTATSGRATSPTPRTCCSPQKTDAFTGIAARGGDAGRMLQRRRDRNADGRGGLGELLRRSWCRAANRPVLHGHGRIRRGTARRDHFRRTLAFPVRGRSPAVVGRLLRLDSAGVFADRYSSWKDYTIVGVMPGAVSRERVGRGSRRRTGCCCRGGPSTPLSAVRRE